MIDAADGPGFLVNRCNRPFGLEALRLLSERLADVETIDRICRLGGGFRMGPFELSDLVGVDVGFEVSKSFYELSFGEPRWRPSPLQRADGRRRPPRAQDRPRLVRLRRRRRTAPEDRRARRRRAAATGCRDRRRRRAGRRAARRRARRRAGTRASPPRPTARCPTLVDRLRTDDEEGSAGPAGWAAAAAVRRRLAGRARSRAAAPSAFTRCRRLPTPSWSSCTRGPDHSRPRSSAPSTSSRRSGKHVEWVGDAPGLVLGRIVCQLINEAAFALGEGVGSARGHRRRHGARPQPPARPAGVGGRDRPRSRARRARGPAASTTARSATGRPRCCAGWSPRGGWAAHVGAGFSRLRGPEHLTSRPTALR